MFGFMKKHTEKDREERGRRKQEKEEKKKRDKTERKHSKSDKQAATQEELNQLEQARSRLLHQSNVTRGRSFNGSRQLTPVEVESYASNGQQASVSSRYISQVDAEIGKRHKEPPPTKPKPRKVILKEKPNSVSRGVLNHKAWEDLDDPALLERNTRENERIADSVEADVSRMNEVTSVGSSPDDRPPPLPNIPPPPEDEECPDTPPTPSEKTYDNIDLHLPNLAPPRSLNPRDISLKRLPTGDFGFSLRKGIVLERSLDDNTERKRIVIFAEPSPKNTQTGLLPGDRLIEVNGHNVENATREEIIELIRKTGDRVLLKVRPIPELSELSVRSGLEGEEVGLGEQNVKMGTLKRSGSIRYKSKPVSCARRSFYHTLFNICD